MPWPSTSPPEAPAVDASLRAGDAFEAAALLLVDPQALGGVLLRAAPGPVREAWLAFLRAAMPAGMPWARMPVHATEDRLLGGLDLAATLRAGRPVLQPGVLASTDGGVVVAAMAERLPAATAAHLSAALDRGEVVLEREGMARRLPSRIALVALDESQPEEASVAASLADRLGLWVDLRAMSVREVVEAQPSLAGEVALARQRLAQVRVGEDIVQAMCAATLALGIDSARAAWQALRAARARAALRGDTAADTEDAAWAARVVLAPRATRSPERPEAAQPDTEPQPPSPPPPPQTPPDTEDPHPPPGQSDEQAAEPSEPTQALDDVVLAAAAAAIPAGLLARMLAAGPRRGPLSQAGRAGAAAASLRQGRPIGSRPGRPGAGARLHLLDTLRAAAPWQRLRRLQARPPGVPTPLLVVRAEDFQIHRREQRRSTTTVFAVDASGSAALHRLAEAKGAVELLLAQCYVRRDEVAVVAFRGTGAQLLLPPTRSLVRARRALSGLPGGGGTPLAAGIDAASTLVAQARREGATPVVVLLTDGRANVGRDGLGGRARAHEEALAAARALAAHSAAVLLIDTSVRPEPAAQAVAAAAGARYLPLPHADARRLSQAVQAAHAAAAAAP